MFNIYERTIKKSFIDELLWVKSPLVLAHWKSVFPALFLPEYLEFQNVVYWPPVRVKQSTHEILCHSPSG